MPPIGFNPANPIGFVEISWAALQGISVSENRGIAYFCPDAPRGGSCVVSDGVRWRPFAIGTYRDAYTLLTGDNGVHDFVYDQGWTKPPAPMPILVDAAGGAGRLSYNISNATKDGCRVTVRRGATLPSVVTLLGQLANFDPWAGGSVTGVTIFLIAFPME